MLDVATLGLPTASPSCPEPSPDEPPGPAPAPLVPGSVTAKALFRVWSGAELTVVDAPPGSGKTQMVVTILAHLVAGTEMSVMVVTPTRAQAIALAHRTVRQVEPSRVNFSVNGVPRTDLPMGMSSQNGARGAASARKPITIRTLASAALYPPTDADCDLLVLDEAYQATFADVALASAGVPQVLMVGDPGQIGPVVTIDTRAWQHMAAGPHRRAPEVYADMDGAERFSLDRTWRLGAHGARIVAPLYDFDFTSARPERHLVVPSGETLPEVSAFATAPPDGPDDPATLAAVAGRAVDLAGTTLHSEGADPTDPQVAVVVARNSQASVIQAMLRERAGAGIDVARIVVGTADRLQGGEWSAVVALDPLVGSVASEHTLSLGRLCVMCSRHSAHLSWFHDGTWRRRPDPAPYGWDRHLAVRRAICG